MLALMHTTAVPRYLSMLCAMKWGIFLFFAGMVLVMTVFAYLFYPETRGLAIEDAPLVFEKHWFWKHYTKSAVLAASRAQSQVSPMKRPHVIVHTTAAFQDGGQQQCRALKGTLCAG